MAASPSRIPENIDVRRPESQPFIDVPVSVSGLGVIFCPAFLCDRGADLLHHIRVKRCRHPDCLREHSGSSCPGHPVQRLIPPVIGRDSQPLDRRRVKTQLRSLLLQRHSADQFRRSFPCFFSLHDQAASTSRETFSSSLFMAVTTSSGDIISRFIVFGFLVSVVMVLLLLLG